MSGEKPKMYGELAGWWQLISPTEDYADEATFFAGLFREEGVRTLLELGSGGGNIAWFLKRDFSLTLSDLSEEMLLESEKQNPELEHIRGDMRTLRLGRTFDGVFVHDAIAYMTTEDDLRAALATVHEHCRPDGFAVIAPDCVAETFEPQTTTYEGTDDGNRAVRFIEWLSDPDPTDTETNYDLIFALKEGGELRSVVDRQVNGLFPRQTWLSLLSEVGFEPEVVEDTSTEGEERERTEVFVARKP